jgi:serine protease Do
MNNEQLHEWVELYALDLLEADDKIAFEQQLNNDAQLRKMLMEHQAFVRLINHKTSKELVRAQLDRIKKDNGNTIHKIADNLQVQVNKYWKTASVAAGVALIASSLTFMVAKRNYDNELTSTQTFLSGVAKELKKTNKNFADLKTKVDSTVLANQPTGDSKKAGTCFVLNNKGYVVTNAHIVNGYSKVYVFTNDGIGHQANIVKVDNKTDLAILKIAEKEFDFGIGSLPYQFSTKENNMAQRVFTLGYPKGSVVYNEGYISSKMGREDDENFYQLELPSSPGVSGSPVFDNAGNVVAVINSKESIGANTTYALKSNELKNFLKDIDSIGINSSNKLNGLSREQQIKKLEDCVLVVKVY